MTPASERQKRYRDRRRRGVRVYPVEFSDVDLAASLDAGLITDVDALDPVKVAVLIVQLASLRLPGSAQAILAATARQRTGFQERKDSVARRRR